MSTESANLRQIELQPMGMAGNSGEMPVVAGHNVASPSQTASLYPLAKPVAGSLIERTDRRAVPIYLLGGGIDAAESDPFEQWLRQSMPQLEHINSIEQLNEELLTDRNYLLYPFSDIPFDQLVDMVESARDDLFFILICDEVKASDYKRLVQTGRADWVSARSAPQEIFDIIMRHQRSAKTIEPARRCEFVLVSFLPSGGGVGNATLAVETAVQIKTNRATEGRAVCLVDLDFQTGHVCDLLDIDARLNIEEISQSPGRLDAQLMDLFVSHHASGLDVVAPPRNKQTSAEPNIAALDALFGMLSQRYDLVLVDLPVHWASWTRQILRVSNLAVVTGSNTIPGLRQVLDTAKAIGELKPSPAEIAVVLNRCRSRLIGGVEGQHFVKRVLDTQRVLYVREDVTAARQSVDTGVPVSLASPLSRISKDVAKLSAFVCALTPARLSAAVE
jgi:pilus assembly protein CpaE